VAALQRLHPKLATDLIPIILFNSRAPRPGEVDGRDYHFRQRAEIERLGSAPGFVTCDVRGDLQCLDLGALEHTLQSGGSPFFEGNPFVPEMLREAGILERYPTLSVFVSPLRQDEIAYLTVPERNVDLPSLVTDLMRRKLLRRTTRHKGILSSLDLENIERRAASAIDELRLAWKYDFVIANHDGEDSDNWDAFYYPVGDAFDALDSFVALLEERPAPRVEQWSEDLIPR
jgi:guanylate kinase